MFWENKGTREIWHWKKRNRAIKLTGKREHEIFLGTGEPTQKMKRLYLFTHETRGYRTISELFCFPFFNTKFCYHLLLGRKGSK